MQPRNRTYRKICQYCGKEFLACQARTAYCSERCAKLAVKLKYKNERLKRESAEVREFERLALLDTLSDAAKLMQISRNTLYKIIQLYSIQLQRFTDRTVRIARADLEKAGLSNTAQSYRNSHDKYQFQKVTDWFLQKNYGVVNIQISCCKAQAVFHTKMIWNTPRRATGSTSHILSGCRV